MSDSDDRTSAPSPRRPNGHHFSSLAHTNGVGARCRRNTTLLKALHGGFRVEISLQDQPITSSYGTVTFVDKDNFVLKSDNGTEITIPKAAVTAVYEVSYL